MIPTVIETVERLGGAIRLLVVGDVILDEYVWGEVARISPEAPVGVLSVKSREVRLGGAACVAAIARGWGVSVDLAGVVGNDPAGRTLTRICLEEGIGDCLVCDDGRPTTQKQRLLGMAAGKHAHQMLRVDHESVAAVGETLAEKLLAKIDPASIDRYDAILFSDYAKGVCTSTIAEQLVAHARKQGIPIVVDPPREGSIKRYIGADVLKPNRQEATSLSGQAITSIEDAFEAASSIAEEHQLGAVAVTLDSDGIALVDGENHAHFPAIERQVYDITGAGDTVLASIGLALSTGTPLGPAMQFANAAAACQISHWGVAQFPLDEVGLARPYTSRTSERASKVATLQEAAQAAAISRERGGTVVLTNGCFDLLHVGHVRCLEEAREQGDLLIVAVNDDASIRRLKGDSRPVVDESARVAMLSALACVDHVILFDDDTPHRIIDSIRPDVLVKGGTTPEVVGRGTVESYGGRIHKTTEVDGVSTSIIVKQLSN